ncbi:MAG: glycosyltransferase [Lachnospiraceae bacterium]|jgi:tetratricopeptide (TPR) repeat protein|nr:glycosyltransferase [Lachnospiraceae bacterium]
MAKVPVSVCIIAKNEEKYIEECLKRLIPYGFEIVVADTGSTDATKEIARRYADKVLEFEWTDDFSAARNFCAEHASNNWILSLDCDEFVNSVDVPSMRIMMQKYPRHIGTIRLKNLVLKENGEKGYGTDDVTRLYNRNFYCYDFPIHEQVCPRDMDKREEMAQCFLVPMEVIHYGYALPKEEMQKKQLRNLELLYHNLEKNPDDLYTLFQIGQSEFIIGNYEKSVQFYERAVLQNPTTEFFFVHILITSLAKAYVMVGREADALDLMNRYAERCKSARYTFTHAGILLDNNQPLKALLLYIKTTMMEDADTLGENLMYCYEHIIRLYTDMGDMKMAELFKDKYEACRKERERVIGKTE